MSAKRPKIGDIIEIPVKGGFAYVQYVNKHNKPPRYGALLLVMPTIYLESLKDFSKLDLSNHYYTFFPLGTAVNRGIFQIVGNTVIPDFAKKFPLFKNGFIDKDGNRVGPWWLWDGEKSWRVGDLNSEQKKLSDLGIWNDTLLIERIEQGWGPVIS